MPSPPTAITPHASPHQLLPPQHLRTPPWSPNDAAPEPQPRMEGARKRAATSEQPVAEFDLTQPVPAASAKRQCSVAASSQPRLLDLALSDSDTWSDGDEEGEWGLGSGVLAGHRVINNYDFSGEQAQNDELLRSRERKDLELQKIIDSIPLDDRAPVGHARRRRLVKKKDYDAETGVGIQSFDDDIDGVFGDGGEEEEEEEEGIDERSIELDRIKIEEAAKRIGCRPMVVKVTRREALVKVDERGEAIAPETVPDEPVGKDGPAAAPRNGNRPGGLLAVLNNNEDEEMEVVSEDQLGRLQDIRQFKEITEEKVRWRVPGMRTPLLDHQVLGLDWMLDHEMSPARPKGGLVADAMGLGKTIQTIATMIKNMPDETDPQVTLIVAPLALLQQWKDEILQHTKRNQFQVFINHGANKIKKLKDLKNKDVVLTTYNSIMFSCPKTKRPDDVTPGEYKEWFEDQFDRHRGIFHRMKFWRVILDEAHVIKNRRSRTSIACQRLDAEYTWALSGTPIQNSLYDIFPIFSFIGHPTAGNLDYFEAMMQSGVSDSIKAQRIQALLRSCYMRRTKNEILLGRRLITLPRKRVRMVELEFGEEERSLYMAVEQYSRDVINGYIRRGTHTKNYSNILTLLLRLRQICNHPYLILTTINNDFTANELDQALDSGVDGEKPSGLKLLLQAAQITPVGDLSECAICLGALEQPVMGRCRHLFCRACIVDVLTTLVQAGKDATCPLCRRPISEAELHTPEGFDAPTPSDADSGDWLDSVGAFMHSAKTLALQDQLAEWAANHPGDKVVLFSQFTKMLDIVERVLDNATGGVRWGYCRYDGAMGISEREESLRLFRADPATHIMLTSIKAGGVGLNLTKANLVVSLDLWWNAATELQAFDRVHRLGQTKEVFVTRFLVKSTVEERILETQEAKRALADAALGEGKADLGRLSIDKLMGLFGNLVTRNGRMQIEADYDRAQMLVRAREAGDRRAARGAAVEVLE